MLPSFIIHIFALIIQYSESFWRLPAGTFRMALMPSRLFKKVGRSFCQSALVASPILKILYLDASKFWDTGILYLDVSGHWRCCQFHGRKRWCFQESSAIFRTEIPPFRSLRGYLLVPVLVQNAPSTSACSVSTKTGAGGLEMLVLMWPCRSPYFHLLRFRCI